MVKWKQNIYSKKFKFDHNDIKAFGILGITVGLKWDKIQKKFKKLVKKFHPDINAGDKKFEEKLKKQTGMQNYRIKQGAAISTDILQAKNALAKATSYNDQDIFSLAYGNLKGNFFK